MKLSLSNICFNEVGVQIKATFPLDSVLHARARSYADHGGYQFLETLCPDAQETVPDAKWERIV